MSKKVALSAEQRNSVVWLERQPGVLSVVVGRRVGVRHRHKAGFAKVTEQEPKGVRLLCYDVGGCHNLFVHAPASPDRDRWVAAVKSGDPFAHVAAGNGHKRAKEALPKPAATFSADVPSPAPTNSHAGQLFDVTPALAAKWLERNTRNRPLRDAVVQKYATDMKEGRWMVTGDAIAFDTSGAIVNGQHRLWAVFEAGLTVPMLVCFDLDPKVVGVLDDHMRRKLTDVIHIARPGSTVQTKHTACARTMMFNLEAVDRRGALARTSRQRQVEFLDRHWAAIDFVFADCFHGRSVKSLTNANLAAVLARAYYTQDRARIKQFGEAVLSGVIDSRTDDGAVITFRNWILRETGVRAKGEIIYRKAERALWSFLRKEPLRMLYEAAEELFPLPEEQAPVKAKKGTA